VVLMILMMIIATIVVVDLQKGCLNVAIRDYRLLLLNVSMILVNSI